MLVKRSKFFRELVAETDSDEAYMGGHYLWLVNNRQQTELLIL